MAGDTLSRPLQGAPAAEGKGERRERGAGVTESTGLLVSVRVFLASRITRIRDPSYTISEPADLHDFYTAHYGSHLGHDDGMLPSCVAGALPKVQRLKPTPVPEVVQLLSQPVRHT